MLIFFFFSGKRNMLNINTDVWRRGRTWEERACAKKKKKEKKKKNSNKREEMRRKNTRLAPVWGRCRSGPVQRRRDDLASHQLVAFPSAWSQKSPLFKLQRARRQQQTRLQAGAPDYGWIRIPPRPADRRRAQLSAASLRVAKYSKKNSFIEDSLVYTLT